MKKTILITGTSTGIGRATAEYFAQKGWNVAATMRKPQPINDQIKVYSLDVTNVSSIEKAIQDILNDFGSIDVLFNNAGYALVGAFETMTDEQIKQQFDTNVFGMMKMIRAILPHFRSKKSGLIINTTSMGGLITFPLYSAYHATKWAIEGFAESLQYELRQFNIQIKNIEPGAIKTNFDHRLEFTSSPEYERYTTQVNANLLSAYDKAPGPESIAKIVYRAATDNRQKLRYIGGSTAKVLIFIKRFLPFSLYRWLTIKVTEKGVKQ